MRRRVVSQQIPPTSYQVTVYKNNTLADNPPGTYPATYTFAMVLPFGYTKYEVMWDESWPDRSRKSWKKVEHYKLSFPDYLGGIRWDYTTWMYGSSQARYRGHLPPLLGYNSWRVPPPFGYLGQQNSNLPTMYSEREDGGFVPEPSGLIEMQNRALSVILPKVKADLSLINSVLELKDFKSLAATLSAMKAFTSAVYKTLKAHGWNTLKHVFGSYSGAVKGTVGGGASGYLFNQFAVLPLISDFFALGKALKSLERRVNDLITREGRVQVRHCSYRVTLPDVVEVDHGEAYSLNQGPYSGDSGSRVHRQTMKTSRSVKYDETVFHVQVEYNYNFTRYQREHARMLVLLDALGWNFNPSIIWNALPLSFLVDWLANLSVWFDQFSVGNMDPKINIRRCLWSIKGKRAITLDVRSTTNVTPPVPKTLRTKLPVCYETAYRRERFTPTMSSLLVSGLSSKELTLGAALVLASKRRRR